MIVAADKMWDTGKEKELSNALAEIERLKAVLQSKDDRIQVITPPLSSFLHSSPSPLGPLLPSPTYTLTPHIYAATRGRFEDKGSHN